VAFVDISSIVERIRKNVYSIDIVTKKGKRLPFQGTAFAFSDSKALTAYHVVHEQKNVDYVELVEPGGKRVNGKMVSCNETADIALIETETALKDCDPFSPSEAPPALGSPCLWGGFPHLVGEPSVRRMRLAWGNVSSESYGNDNATFFDVDGAFSPGHSGSPVICNATGQLIGVVSGSVGSVMEYFERTRAYVEALAVLSETGFLDDLTKALEDFGSYLYDLDKALDDKGIHFRTGVPRAHEWHSSYLEEKPPAVLKAINECGIRAKQIGQFNFDGQVVKQTWIYGTPSEVFRGLVGLMLKVVSSVQEAIDYSFQMFIGTASGGRPMVDLMR